MSRHKKLLCSVLAFLQATQPLVAGAADYFYRIPLDPLKVRTGAPLPQVNVDPTNSTSTTVRLGEAVLRIAPSDVNFGTVETTKSSTPQTVTLYNLGGKALTLGALSASSQFTVTDGCDGVVVPPLGNCQVNTTFQPSQVAAAVVAGKLTVPFSSGDQSAIAYADLSGTAAAPPTGAAKLATLGGGDLQSTSPSGSDGGTASGSQSGSMGGAQLSFPLAIINQQSWPRSFQLSSTGDTPLDFRGLTFIGNDGSYTATSDCPASVPVGTACTVTVTFAPHSVGTKQATLVVNTTSYQGNSLPVSVTGEAIEVYPVYGSTSTASVDFGTLVQGGAVVKKNISIANSGTAPMTIGTLGLQGASTAGLSVSATTCGSPVPANGSCTVELSYSPAVANTLDAQLVVPHDGRLTPASPVTIPVTGKVDAQTRTLGYAGVLDWGNTDTGVATTKPLTITNTGNSPVSGITVATTTPFSVLANGCTGVTLQPKDTCTVTFSLTYSTNGAISRAATVGATALTTPAAALTLQANVWTRSIAALSPTSLAYGLQTSQAWSTDEKFVTVTNTGNVTVKPVVSGRSSSDNTLSSAVWIRVSSDTCVAGVAPGATCQFGFQVKPTSSTALSATVSVYPDVGMTAGARTVSVTATGTTQSYSLSTSALDFGTIGSLQYAERTITVTNTSPAGTAVTGFSGVSFTQPTAPAGSGTLSVPTNTCASTLASQASCVITVRYTAPSYVSATAVDTTGGAVSFYWTGARSNTSTIPATATVAGTTVTASVSSNDFGDVPAGVAAASAARRVVTLRNTGAYPATIYNYAYDANALFLTEDTSVVGRCTSSATLAANASCTYTFYSSIASTNGGGQKNTTVTVRVNHLNGIANVTGTATPFTGNVLPATVATSVSSIDFGTVGERTSVSKTFTFQTTHGGAAMLAGTSVTGTGYTVAVTGCSNNANVAAGTVCTATVTFTPGAYSTAQMNGQVQLLFTVEGASKVLATVTFTAQVEKASYAVDYNDLNWGDVPTQTAGYTRYAVVRNTSTNAVFPIGATVAASPFNLNATTGTYTYNGTAIVNCSSLAQLNPGQSCHFNVTLSGRTAAQAGSGPYSGNATFQSTAALGGLSVPMTANFLTADPQMANSVVFANPTPSTTTHNPDMALTITNAGGGRMYWTTPTGASAPLSLSGNFWMVRANGATVQAATPATVANSTRCEENLYVEPGASCTLTLRFIPTGAAGTKTTTLKLGTLNPSAQSYAVALSGTALAGSVYMNQSALDFSKQLVSSTTTQTILIGNGGDGPMDMRNIQRQRADGTGAAYPTELTAAHDCPSTLQPGQECHINVTFAPDRNLDWGALASKEVVQFDHYTNGAWTTVKVPLSGVGYGANLTVDHLSHNLGGVDRAVVAQDYTDTLTFTASGPAPVRIMSFAPTTLSYLETYAGGTCATALVLQPGDSCTLNIRNRADFSTYGVTQYTNQTQQVFTINGTLYKADGTTVQSDRSAQLLASANIVYPITLAEVNPRSASTQLDSPGALFGTGFRAGAATYLDGAALPNTFYSTGELRFTLPAGLATGTHTVQVRNTDGRNLTKSLNFTVVANGASKDVSNDVYTTMTDRPYTGYTVAHSVALDDGRLVHVDSGGNVVLTDANGYVTARAVASVGGTASSFRASVSGNSISVAWLAVYSSGWCSGYYYYGSCQGSYYYSNSVESRLQTFTVSGSTLVTGQVYASTLYSTSYGAANPSLIVEGYGIGRSGAQTLESYSFTINSYRYTGVRVWNNSTSPGTTYSLPVPASGSMYAMGTLLRGTVGFVRWGDRIYAYDVSGTALAGGASYQYSAALGSDAVGGLAMASSTGELMVSCYSNRAICVIPTAGSALGTASLLTGDPTTGGYVDGSYANARFQSNFIAPHPAGVVVYQAGSPNASRVVKR
jgi:hypothetical protein